MGEAARYRTLAVVLGVGHSTSNVVNRCIPVQQSRKDYKLCQVLTTRRPTFTLSHVMQLFSLERSRHALTKRCSALTLRHITGIQVNSSLAWEGLRTVCAKHPLLDALHSLCFCTLPW